MKRLSFPLAAACLLAHAVCAYPAEEAPRPQLALQGFTGILNTPNAHVGEEGRMYFMYSDQRENFWRTTKRRQENYMLSVGLFDFAEVGARLTEAPSRSASGGVRDLSANFKVSSAFLTRDKSYLPVLAAGIQDVGGGANLLQARYLAVSEDIWRLRLSAGYGFGPRRMKGGFAGGEFKAHEWVTLLGEYDTRETNVGLRLSTPALPVFPVSFMLTGKTSLTYHPGTIDVAAGFSFPLDFREQKVSPPVKTVAAVESGTSAAAPAKAVPPPAPAVPSVPPRTEGTTHSGGNKATAAPTADRQPSLETLRARLVENGFVNVRVGQKDGTILVVEYENVRYNHNELDALGVVAGMAAEYGPSDLTSVWMVVKRKGIAVLKVAAPLEGLRSWLSGQQQAPPEITVDNRLDGLATVRFVEGDSNPGWLKPSLILSPGLTTFVGTEVGVFDYLLSIKPELNVTTWKGGVLNARWDLPVAWSDNFRNGRTFGYARNNARMDRLMLFQGIRLAPGLMANLGGGMILHDTWGTLNEVVWTPESGTHRIRLAQSLARDDRARKNLDVWLGSYRFYLAPLDLFLEGTAGKFWGQDTGGMVELRRFFSDTSVGLYYKHTETEHEHKRWQVAGIAFTFPLTPRRDMRLSPLQIRGADEWGYAQETILAINGQKTNDTISASLGVNPQPAAAIYRSYNNRDRMNEAYIRQHLDRLKEAWSKYRE